MCLKFAKQCLKLEKMKELFPKNQSFHTMEKRCPEYYKVIKTTKQLKLDSLLQETVIFNNLILDHHVKLVTR